MDPASNDNREVNLKVSPNVSDHKSEETKQLYFDLYNIGNRSEQPRKRVKLDSNSDVEHEHGGKSTFVHRSTGIVGDYLKPNEDETAKLKMITNTVDLTNGTGNFFSP